MLSLSVIDLKEVCIRASPISGESMVSLAYWDNLWFDGVHFVQFLYGKSWLPFLYHCSPQCGGKQVVFCGSPFGPSHWLTCTFPISYASHLFGVVNDLSLICLASRLWHHLWRHFFFWRPMSWSPFFNLFGFFIFDFGCRISGFFFVDLFTSLPFYLLPYEGLFCSVI